LPPHLFVDISAHGFGHLAQTAPVLNALHAQLPDLRIALRTMLPMAQLKRKLVIPFQLIAQASDFGLCMHNAVDVDVPGSLRRYEALHADWEQQVSTYALELRQHRPTLLVSNISYLALAAAEQAQIPALAMCSLNWRDIFQPYVSTSAQYASMLTQMLGAYNSAQAFLRLTPGMDMPDLLRRQEIGPIAECGKAQINLLRRKMGLDSKTRIVLRAMGGIPMAVPETWPRIADVAWIMPQANVLPRPDIFSLENMEMRFSDLLASCDAVVTKSGYGVFTEATLVGTPVLYLERPDWPEQPSLVHWLHQHNRAQSMTRADYDSGAFASTLQDLLGQSRAPGMMPTGISMAVEEILRGLH